MKRALARLLTRLESYPHGYEPSAQIFLPLEAAKLERELDPTGRGVADGKLDEPPSDGLLPGATEQQIAARLEAERKHALDVLAERQRLYDERLGRLDVGGRAFEISTHAG